MGLVYFLKCSNHESIIQECALIAERWNWGHEEIMSLPTDVRREYIDLISDMYEREKEAMNKK